MRIKFTLNSGGNDEGAFYQWDAEVDVVNADEAYVKGREFHRLTKGLRRGYEDEATDTQEAETE